MIIEQKKYTESVREILDRRKKEIYEKERVSNDIEELMRALDKWWLQHTSVTAEELLNDLKNFLLIKYDIHSDIALESILICAVEMLKL